MKSSEIKIGGYYSARISGKFVTLKVISEKYRTATRSDPFSGRSRDIERMGWMCLNVDTGRQIEVKSAQRFRGVATLAEKAKPRDGDVVDSKGLNQSRISRILGSEIAGTVKVAPMTPIVQTGKKVAP